MGPFAKDSPSDLTPSSTTLTVATAPGAPLTLIVELTAEGLIVSLAANDAPPPL
jgi:hypothetical protein